MPRTSVRPGTAPPPRTLAELSGAASHVIRFPPVTPQGAGTRRLGTVVRRMAGGALVLLPLLPLHRLLAHPRTGLAGEATVRTMEAYGDFMVSGIFIVGLVAVAAGLLPWKLAAGVGAALGRLGGRGDLTFAGTLAVISGALTLVFTLLVLRGEPNAVDSVVQLLHARFWTEGRLAGPTEGAAFWTLQNAVFTARGWVSQYPPGHVLVLAVGLAAGALPLVGAVMVGVTVFFGARLALRLQAHDPAAGRLGAMMLALCPFFVLLGGSYMNHVTAATFVTMGGYALLRAWEAPGHGGWALVAGFAFSWAMATRPLSTVAMAAALVLTIPFAARELGGSAPGTRVTRLVALMVAGAIPVTAAFLAYNAWFFGHPLRMGYEVALGPSMRLGFHQDPWGNLYGWREALAWTASDLRALSVNLFEAPLPAVAVIGTYLLAARRMSPAVRVYVAWATAPVLTNALYWHHGIFMGPRMLHEAAPAWALLFAASAVGLVRLIPPGARVLGRMGVRNGVAGGLVFSTALGLLVLAPLRAVTYGPGEETAALPTLPEVAGPSLVFVHDAWPGRIAMTLAAHGFRLDQVETLLRQNSTCTVDALAQAAAAAAVARVRELWSAMDTIPRADKLPPRVAVAPGYLIRVLPGEGLTPECRRQAHSDRFGVVDLAPFTWRGDLPGGEVRGALYIRDMGPERNAAMVELHSGREPLVYSFVSGSPGPVLLPYDEGMRLLWGEGEDPEPAEPAASLSRN